MTSTKIFASAATAALFLAACDTTQGMDDGNMDAQSLMQIQEEFPDMSAVEFAVLDDNNDGLLSAQERMDIGDDGSNEIEVDDN